MTPKERYEERRRQRREHLDGLQRAQTQSERDSAEIIEMIDRFVTAVEKIADVLANDRGASSSGGGPLTR